jgi:ABC-type polysaccharide/polyol phosphate transport system ATPase subunit
MAHIRFDNVTLQYPIYSSQSMSLRKKLVHISTGGKLSQDAKHVTTVTALNQVSFELQDGDAIGLVGHNGAGKTTLLRAMAGIYKPTFGHVSIEGSVSTIIEIGAGMDPELSGYENIFRMGLLLGSSMASMEEKIGDIERFTELGDFLKIPVHTYSSGMTMRLMFAVATSVRPEILLIDEMFGTGDAAFQEKAKHRMMQLIDSAKIFVFASHDPDLIKRFCKRVFRLEHGGMTEVVQKIIDL